MNKATVRRTTDAEAAPEPALGHLVSHVWFWTTAGLLLWLDLWSKDWVFRALPPDRATAFIPDFIDFRRSLNDGAVFGAFTGHVGLFMVASLFALAFVFYLFANSPRTYRGLHIALACILAGALGNLYDRAFMKADIVTYRMDNGTSAGIIGIIVDETDDVIRLGEWPQGTSPRTFRRSEVSVRSQGVVRDFVKFVPRFPQWVPRLGKKEIWPWVFNVADSALVCGVGALVFTSWLQRRIEAQA